MLEREQEDNWFFRLSAFQEPLERLYAEQPGLRDAAHPLQRGARRSSSGGLEDVSLTRAQAAAGACRCRGTQSQVFYVWFDALLNYYTALSYAREGEDLTERFWPAAST